MKTIIDILTANETIVYFVYGQAFFTLGVILALQSRKHSRLPLAGHLKWLAAYGLVHGAYEWGHAFIPVQQTYLSPSAISALVLVRTAILVLSFCLLVEFGLLIAFPRVENSLVLRLLPLAMLVIWLVISVVTQTFVVDDSGIVMRSPQVTDLARLILGFTGAVLSSFGMFRQASIVGSVGSTRIATSFRWSAICFATYAVIAGLIASRGEWTLLALIDSTLLVDIGSIPPPILRPLAALGISIGVIRGLAVFQIETDRLVEERDELERNEAARARLFARVIAAQEEERKRVARELHDETGQHLSAVLMGLGAVAEALPPGATKAEDILESVRNEAVYTLDSVRHMILGLRPALLDDLGLAPALRRVAEDLARHASFTIEVKTDGLDRRLPPQVETVLFRILQEGMTNVARHSKARRAVLQLTSDQAEAKAVLEDDGIGFDPVAATAHLETGCGLGLVGMRERALQLGGTVAIDSRPAGGTRITVKLPLAGRK